ncbi:MAG TPA: acyl carrier protein [Gemmatimonadales bacterium]|nr:acyl carrier protein [Gemmatimonadales bacterium]
MTGTIETVQAQLTALFERDLNVHVPSPETDLLETGRLDSVGMVELLVQLENRFHIRVELENLEIEQFRSIAAIATFIVARSNGHPGHARHPG